MTTPATGVSDTAATVRGHVYSPTDTTISYWFEYGETKGYGSETTHRSLAIDDRDAHPVSERLTGLSPGTTHHYRVCAKEYVAVCGADRKFTTTGGVTELSITTDPALYPDFDPEIEDYVTRCDDNPVAVDVAAPADTDVAIDGGAARNGSFSRDVPLASGERFELSIADPAQTTTHHVRCLPADFPEWTFERFAPPQQQWYIVTVDDYVVVLDSYGVPVWWYEDLGSVPTDDDTPVDAKYLADGTLAWASARTTANARYDVRALDGSLVRELKTVGTLTDGHDLQLLPNGNYLLMSYKPRAGTVDLSPYGTPPNNGPSDAEVIDAELQEIDPDDPNNPVWTWNSKDHVDLEEVGHWWDDGVLFPFGQPTDVFDIVHINSAEATANSVVVSMRHTDGVYKIDRSDGSIVWKLGGTETAESLTVLDDPHGQNPFGGQHDARILPDGTLTVFDNGWTRNRPPRAVRYRIDEAAGTATYLESVLEPGAPNALCCGSARRSASGGWLVGWGNFPATNPISEFAANGTRTFKLSFDETFSYRAHPVPSGELGRAALRGGMDSQHPR